MNRAQRPQQKVRACRQKSRGNNGRLVGQDEQPKHPRESQQHRLFLSLLRHEPRLQGLQASIPRDEVERQGLQALIPCDEVEQQGLQALIPRDEPSLLRVLLALARQNSQ